MRIYTNRYVVKNTISIGRQKCFALQFSFVLKFELSFQKSQILIDTFLILTYVYIQIGFQLRRYSIIRNERYSLKLCSLSLCSYTHKKRRMIYIRKPIIYQTRDKEQASNRLPPNTHRDNAPSIFPPDPPPLLPR